MATNNFLPFCETDTGTNLLSQTDYAASPYLPIGNQPGVASSQLVNKVLRQATAIAAAVAQTACDITGLNMIDDGELTTLIAAIKQAFQSPIGSIQAFGGAAAPTGWALCDGSSLARTGTYAGLFAVLGTTFGAVDGSHFNVPDLRGIFIRGAGTNGTLTRADAGAFSGTLGTYQNDGFQGHWHAVNDPTHSHLINSTQDGVVGGTNNFGPGSGSNGTSTSATVAVGTGLTVRGPSSDGTNGTPRSGNQTNPANLGLTYIIKF